MGFIAGILIGLIVGWIFGMGTVIVKLDGDIKKYGHSVMGEDVYTSTKRDKAV